MAQHPRRVPFSLREKGGRKLHELGQMDIKDQHHAWVSPIVVVPKPSGEIIFDYALTCARQRKP